MSYLLKNTFYFILNIFILYYFNYFSVFSFNFGILDVYKTK